jgi:DNA-binding response OmpR family regulator
LNQNPAGAAQIRRQIADEMCVMNVVSANGQDTPAKVAPAHEVFIKLAGSRLALVGFDSEANDGMIALFEAAGASCRVFKAAALSVACRNYDVVLLWIESLPHELAGILPKAAGPVIAAVTADSLVQHHRWIRESAADCLFSPCTAEELLTRVALALHRYPARSERSSDGPFCVLIADDDPSIAALLTVTLEREGMVCRAVSDGARALDVARVWRPDLIVLDVNMPDMTGYEVLTALKSDVVTRSLPVMLLTGQDKEADVLRGLQLGAADYMVKPFDPAEALKRIKRIAQKCA